MAKYILEAKFIGKTDGSWGWFSNELPFSTKREAFAEMEKRTKSSDYFEYRVMEYHQVEPEDKS